MYSFFFISKNLRIQTCSRVELVVRHNLHSNSRWNRIVVEVEIVVAAAVTVVIDQPVEHIAAAAADVVDVVRVFRRLLPLAL